MLRKSVLTIPALAKHTSTLVVLHGLGADGSDLAPIAQALQNRGLHHIKFILPTAPMRPVSINNGMLMPAWYDINHTFSDDMVGLEDSRNTIEALIKSEEEEGIPSTRVALTGFSQGAALSIFAGLSHKKPLAGVIALSGYLPAAIHFQKWMGQANKLMPILMMNGIEDEVIKLQYAERSYNFLKDANCNVTFKTFEDLGHSINAEEITEALTFIEKILPAIRKGSGGTPLNKL
eukprot:TRINITY_DN3181_c0_g1_i1.p1 TRINITY_DN3181_c0_g1~~TRINITY_DN3181_c0_g1_i1.p1  ORF type:complete len:234 (-),score=19.81 TRINITY_DN3181_c0_g1_i1:19-720(-)